MAADLDGSMSIVVLEEPALEIGELALDFPAARVCVSTRTSSPCSGYADPDDVDRDQSKGAASGYLADRGVWA